MYLIERVHIRFEGENPGLLSNGYRGSFSGHISAGGVSPSTYLRLVASFRLRGDRPTSTGPCAFMVCKETT